MKRALLNCMFMIVFLCSKAQPEDSVMCNKIAELILEDNKVELSHMMSYPLSREKPLPDIASAAEFIAYYPVLFDDSLKKVIKGYLSSGTLCRQWRGEFIFPEEELTYTLDGHIYKIAYSSNTEQQLKAKINSKTRYELHPSLQKYGEAIITCQTDKARVRIDQMNKPNIGQEYIYRYASWPSGHKMSEKPLLVLNNGHYSEVGAGHWWTYSFKGGDFTYKLIKDPKIGVKLVIENKGTIKETCVCKEIR